LLSLFSKFLFCEWISNLWGFPNLFFIVFLGRLQVRVCTVQLGQA